MSYNLFLTKIHEDQYFLPNKLLGQWSIGDEVQTSNLGNYKIVDYHWDNSEKLDKDYEYLYDLYYELLKSLRISLNNIHKLDKSERYYWQLVLGSWLEMFFSFVHLIDGNVSVMLLQNTIYQMYILLRVIT